MQYCSAGTVLTITNSIICVNILFVYFHLFHDRYLSLVAMLTNDEIDNGRLYSRLHKTWCFPLCCCACNCLFSPFRRLVSRSKRRLKVDDFDIDMALITPRIIVHGFPAIGLEHLYRNPRGEILRYLDTYHHDKWKLYNFCCEKGRSYDPAIFHNRVERYPFKDHSTPLLKTMIAFADSAKSWLDGDSERVVSMHCKAGKGRAGLMCCVLLIRTGECQSAAEAMAHYDKTRVKNNKGLTVTSQRKWVMFYEMLWRNYWNAPLGVNIGTMPTEGNGVTYALPEEPILVLTGVEVLNCSCLENITVTVAQGTHFAPVHLCSSIATEKKQTKFLTPCHVKGNFKVSVIHRPGVLRKATKVCDLWHNTLFLDSKMVCMDFPVDQLDIKRKQIPKYGMDFVVRLVFNSKNADVTQDNCVIVRLDSSASHDAMAVEDSFASSKNPINDEMQPSIVSVVEMKDVVNSDA